LERLRSLHAVRSAVQASDIEDPPGFVQLVAHPLRWRLLRELTRSDRAVRELTERLHAPQNLVSYHLRRLRDGGLVYSRRSAADGRDRYYAIDLTHCEQELQMTAEVLHPGLWRTVAPPTPQAVSGSRRRRVLFLCTGNSARSQIAEGLLKHISAGTDNVASAGSHPKPVHANAVRVMRTRGIDISGNRSKHLNEFVSQPFDLVITLCDRVREVCRDLPWQTELVHWSIPDPVREATTNRASYPAFERTAAELETRMRFLIPLLADPPTGKTRRSSHVEC
jgi:ArsR family transcriptional regulator, arsenate/arsenite/antimonite-responsive transcriptional repressor / arsenate reductase (thioredoxin)